MNKQLIRYAIIAIIVLGTLIPLEWAMSSRNEVLAAPTPTVPATQVAQLASLQVLTATATLTQTVIGADPTKPPATVTTPVNVLQVPAMTPTTIPLSSQFAARFRAWKYVGGAEPDFWLYLTSQGEIQTTTAYVAAIQAKGLYGEEQTQEAFWHTVNRANLNYNGFHGYNY